MWWKMSRCTRRASGIGGARVRYSALINKEGANDNDKLENILPQRPAGEYPQLPLAVRRLALATARGDTA